MTEEKTTIEETEEEDELETEEDDNETDEGEENGGPKSGAKRILVSFAVAAVLIVGGLVYVNKDQLADLTTALGIKSNIAAVVNGEEVTFDLLESRYNQILPSLEAGGLDTADEAAVKEAQSQILDSLVGEVLLLQDAASKGIVVDDSEVQSFYDNTVQQVGGQDELDVQLAEGRLTREEFKENIKRQLIAQKYVNQEIADNLTVSEEELAVFYEEVKTNSEDIPPLEEIRDQAINEIKQRKLNQTLTTLIDQLKTEAEIKLNI